MKVKGQSKSKFGFHDLRMRRCVGFIGEWEIYKPLGSHPDLPFQLFLPSHDISVLVPSTTDPNFKLLTSRGEEAFANRVVLASQLWQRFRVRLPLASEIASLQRWQSASVHAVQEDWFQRLRATLRLGKRPRSQSAPYVTFDARC